MVKRAFVVLAPEVKDSEKWGGRPEGIGVAFLLDKDPYARKKHTKFREQVTVRFARGIKVCRNCPGGSTYSIPTSVKVVRWMRLPE